MKSHRITLKSQKITMTRTSHEITLKSKEITLQKHHQKNLENYWNPWRNSENPRKITRTSLENTHQITMKISSWAAPDIHRAAPSPAALRTQGVSCAAAADALTLLGLGHGTLGKWSFNGFSQLYWDWLYMYILWVIMLYLYWWGIQYIYMNHSIHYIP